MADAILTQERLKELLHYNPETGIFKWIVDSRNKRVKAGMVAGCLDGEGYLIVTIEKKPYKAHRLAFLYMLGEFPKEIVDHINGVKSCNAFSNLRECNVYQNSQNQKNKQANNLTGKLGVTKIKSTGRFQARIQVNGSRINLGHYETVETAYKVYIDFKRKMHEFCTI
jgi:hypothetical protein